MASVEDVAQIIIDYMNAKEEPYVSNLMVNKLLYFAQGHCLAETGRPLFEDDFEAWDYGPVIPKIYNKYKICGKNNIYSSSEYAVERDVLDWEQLPVVEDVLEQYSVFSPSMLVSITHEENSPWEKAKKNANKDERHVPIKKQAIKNYFQTIPLGDDFESLSNEASLQLEDYEKAKRDGSIVTYSQEEVLKRCGLAG